jgi:hypothetical protein
MSFVTILKLLVIAASAPLNGYVLGQLWRWFMVPLGVQAISIAAAMGIIVTVALVHWSSWRFVVGLATIDRQFVTHMVYATWGAPVVAFGLGWLCQYAGTF